MEIPTHKSSIPAIRAIPNLAYSLSPTNTHAKSVKDITIAITPSGST